MPNFSAVILAAGEGKRMKSDKPKVLQDVLFKPLIDWVTDAAIGAGAEAVCVVTGFGAGLLEEHLGGRFETAMQREQLGTGHAVLQAAEFIKAHRQGDIVILCGDAPLIGAEALSASLTEHRTSGNDATVLTAKLQNPTGYGRILRDSDGRVSRIVEEKDASPAEKAISEINSGAYWFRAEALLGALSALTNDNAQQEYYLTDTVGILYAKGHKTGTFVLPDARAILGANDRAQLSALNEAARSLIFERLFDRGVSIPVTDGVMVGPDVTVGRDTTLLPGTILRGRTVIGEGCVIGPNSLCEDTSIGNFVSFNASQAYRAKVGDRATIGPFTHLRPNSVLDERVHVGNFAEVKNSNIGAGSKVSHLTYVGDSDVGRNVNFGCGSVTCNYDGEIKWRTVVGDNTFIGCNTNLVAPVVVAANSYTAAGSTITKEVPEGALAVARARQENIEGWVERKRSAKSKKDHS